MVYVHTFYDSWIFHRDKRWSKMRNTIVSLYQPSHLTSLIPTMHNFITSATHNLDSEPLDIVISNLFLKLTTDIIGQAAFGVNFNLSGKKPSKDVEVTDFINQHVYSTTQLKMDLSGSLSIILGLLIPILQEPFRQVLKRIPGTMDWRVEKTNARLSGQLNEIVSKRAKEAETTDSKDFLSLILKARESDPFAKKIFTPDYISAVTYEHLLAGSATTAFTLSSVLYLVSGHLEVEKRLLQEIDAFGSRDLIPTAHDLQYKFPYLDQVLHFVTNKTEKLCFCECIRIFYICCCFFSFVGHQRGYEILYGFTFGCKRNCKRCGDWRLLTP